MISTKHKFVFLRIPKSAGKSIDEALKPYYIRNLPTDLKTKDFEERDIKFFSAHFSYRDLLYSMDKIEAMRNLDIENFFKFAFVRNPWGRMASYFIAKQRKGSRCLEDRQKLGYLHRHAHEITKQFSRWLKKEGRGKEKYDYTESASAYPMLHVQQIQYITEDMTAEGRVAVDFVGRLESLKKDIGSLERLLGIKINLPSRKLGKTRRKHYSFYYDKEGIEIISDLFAKDIEYFGYQYEDRT